MDRYYGLNVAFFCMYWLIYCESEELTILPTAVEKPIVQLSQHLNHLTLKENEIKQPKILLPKLNIIQPKLLQAKLLHVIPEPEISQEQEVTRPRHPKLPQGKLFPLQRTQVVEKNREGRQPDVRQLKKVLPETNQSKVILPETLQPKKNFPTNTSNRKKW